MASSAHRWVAPKAGWFRRFQRLIGYPKATATEIADRFDQFKPAGLPAAEDSLGADQGRGESDRHRPQGTSVVVDPRTDFSEHRHGFYFTELQLIKTIQIIVLNEFLLDHVSE